jgi:hypothetical protein
MADAKTGVYVPVSWPFRRHISAYISKISAGSRDHQIQKWIFFLMFPFYGTYIVLMEVRTVPVASTTDNEYAFDVEFTPKRIFPSSVDPAATVPEIRGFANPWLLAYWEVIAVRLLLVDLYESTNEESVYLKSFLLSLFLMVISRISKTRPALPTPFWREVFFSAELRVTVRRSCAGFDVVERGTVVVLVSARVVLSDSGTAVGLNVGKGVVTTGELVGAEVWAWVDVHPALRLHAVRSMIKTDQKTNVFFIIMNNHVKSDRAWNK